MLNLIPEIEARTDSPPIASTNKNILTAAKGGGIKFFGLLFSYVVRFALGVLMARFMGAEQYGLYSLADTVSYMIIGLAMLGLFSALLRYIPIFTNRQDEASLWGTLQIGLGIPFVMSTLGGIGVFVFSQPLAVMLGDSNLASILKVVGLALPFGTLIAATGAAVRGFNKIEFDVIAEDIFFSLIKLIIVIGLILTGLNAFKAMTAHAIGAVLTTIMLIYFLNRLFSLKRPWNSARRNVKEILGFSLPLYGATLIDIFGHNLHTLLLGALKSVTSAGVFTASSRVNLVSTVFYQAIGTVTMPIISELHSKGEYKQLEHFYRVTTKWTLTFNLPIFLTILLFSKTIMLVFGQDFVGGSIALVILSCGSLIDAGTGINGGIIVMTGRAWLNTTNTLISLTLQTVLNLLLIPSFGIIGAAIAIASTTTFLNILRTIMVFILYRIVPYDKSFIKPIIAAIAATLITLGMMWWTFEENNLVGAGLNVAILMATYTATLLILGLSEEDKMLLRRLRERLKRG